MKDKIGPILIVVVLVFSVIAFTYSWFTWINNEKNRTGVTFDTNSSNTNCIIYSITQNGNKKLIPVSNMEKGYITNINISNNCEDKLVTDINLKIKTITQNLKNKNFKYSFMLNDELIKEGDFTDIRQEETLTLATKQELTKEEKNYKLYLWIDSTKNNIPLKNHNYQFEIKLD